ncbi:MAG: hypothetical protein ABL891_09995 [Burkholderiales bacterium]
MSYELCVLQPGYAADREAAYTAWNDQDYWDASLPVEDRTAAKWRVKDALMAFDSRLHCVEPKAPSTGFFAKWFSKPPPVQRCLHVYLEDGEQETSFDIFDQAIEITLPWDSPRNETEKHVRLLWRYLEHLSASGWSTIYDTERDVLLDLKTDFEMVMARYLKNLGTDEETDSGPVASPAAPKPASAGGRKRDKPFTGNVD